MGTNYEEETSPSILVIYSSENDSPDKFFPADPRLVQAQLDSQNEPRPPPTPPASPVSGVMTPSTTLLPELWEMDRSTTPSPTRDIPMPEIQAHGEDHNDENEQLINVSQLAELEIDQNSNDVGNELKKSVSFAKTLQYINYRDYFYDQELEALMDEIRKLENRRKLRYFINQNRYEAVEIGEDHGCCFWPSNNGNQNIFKKIAKTFGIPPHSKTYRRVSSLFRRVRSFTSRFSL